MIMNSMLCERNEWMRHLTSWEGAHEIGADRLSDLHNFNWERKVLHLLGASGRFSSLRRGRRSCTVTDREYGDCWQPGTRPVQGREARQVLCAVLVGSHTETSTSPVGYLQTGRVPSTGKAGLRGGRTTRAQRCAH